MRKNIMKNVKRLVAGFTIAELVISMLISAVLIAALVPVVGVKKVKYPADKLQHGIAECYYQGGSLRYYYQDNTNPERNQNKAVNSDHCTFTVPATARYVQVFVIGHGGRAVYSDASYSMSNGNKFEGDIHLNNLFQDDIERANGQVSGLANMIKTALNDWGSTLGLTAEFKVSSPIGAGGPGMCHAQILSTDGSCAANCGNGNPLNPSCPGPFENTSSPYYWTSTGDAKIALSSYSNKQAEMDFDCQWDPETGDWNAGCYYCGLYNLGPFGDNCQCAPTVHYPDNHSVCGEYCPATNSPRNCKCDPKIDYPEWHKCYINKEEGGGTGVVFCATYDLETTDCECSLRHTYPVGHKKCNPIPYCSAAVMNPADCECDPNVSYPMGHKCNPVPDDQAGPKCWTYIHGQGQSSGTGRTKTVYVPINGDSTISVDTNFQRAGVSVTTENRERHIYLMSSANGAAPVRSGTDYTTPNTTPAAATCESNIDSGCNGLENTTFNTGTPKGTVIPVGRQCELNYGSANAARRGELESDPIRYSYEPAYINLTHGTAGEPGAIRANVYEKLTGVLNLYPAAAYGGRSYFTKNSTNISVTTPAGAGRDGRMITDTYMISTNIFPVVPEIKKVAKPDNTTVFAEYLSKINSVTVNGGLKGCDRNGTCPGFGGTGSYINIKKVKSGNTLKFTYGENQYPIIDPQGTVSFGANCDQGDTSAPMSNSSGYEFERCYNQNRMQGNPGAVIIVW